VHFGTELDEACSSYGFDEDQQEFIEDALNEFGGQWTPTD